MLILQIEYDNISRGYCHERQAVSHSPIERGWCLWLHMRVFLPSAW
nr:MAG TPA: hypothetical protein [Caudoviricetes sp.]